MMPQGTVRFGDGLFGTATNSCDEDAGVVGPRSLLGSESKYRLEQSDLGIVDRELGGMDANSDSPCPGGVVVAEKRALPAFVQPASSIESQRACWDNQPRA
jgi:hypothetical protein